jgi:hypothetical protein
MVAHPASRITTKLRRPKNGRMSRFLLLADRRILLTLKRIYYLCDRRKEAISLASLRQSF